MSSGKSWFYLTLWRGTPPEFTNEIETEIHESDHVNSVIHKTDSVGSEIKLSDAVSAFVQSGELFGIDIIRKTEVVWYVGVN